MRQYRSLLPFCLAVAMASGLAGPAARATEVSINVSGNSFVPRTVTIQAGDTVTWSNNSQGFHNVASDDENFVSGTPSESWTFSHTFNTAGVFEFHCEVHGAMGMTGSVTVQGGGGGGNDTPGTIRFAQTGYSVSEGGNKATIAVSRVDGDDGPATIQWAATAGTATAGSDFTAASDTLSWAAGDHANKSFQVTILNNTVAESNETVTLTLSNPTGAALDLSRRIATLTITDDDSAGPSAPAAPTNLTAAPQSTTEIQLTWTDAATNETGFRIERRTLSEPYEEIGTVGANITSFVASGLTSGTFYVFRVRAQNSAGNSPYSNEAGAAPNATPLPCLASDTALCVTNNRFQVAVEWRIPDGTNGHGQAVPVPSAPASGLFYFFDPTNLEMLIKVLNACGLSNRYWVFFAATTNVEFGVTVTDTQNGQVKSYFNPLSHPASPVQDTNAFATCP
ncbi:MAG TPA: Calx-beta domain-containing protein [Thermoanaerobaculia bacterium]|nr:Calx-beta domain-containing protein [Thermoanaerobaculia bacterium]